MPDETTSTSTSTTVIVSNIIAPRPLQSLGDFVETIYPKYILKNNKLPYDILKLGNNEYFSLVQLDALPSWLSTDDVNIKGVSPSNTVSSSSIVVINYKEPNHVNTKIYIVDSDNVTSIFPITKNNQIFALPVGKTFTNFYITKVDVINSPGVPNNTPREVVVYSYAEESYLYTYTLENAYANIYERTGVESRVFKGTFPIYKSVDADGKNYQLLVDLQYRDLFSITDKNLVTTPNYQIEAYFKNPNTGNYELQGAYSYLTKLPTDILNIGIDNLIPSTTRNISSLETITEVLVLLAKLKYIYKKADNNFIYDHFEALLATLETLPRVSNLFYSKYTFDEVNDRITIFNDGANIAKIVAYPNLYMACRFLESKDPDLVNFVNNSGLLNALYSLIEISQINQDGILSYNNLIREGISVEYNNNIGYPGEFSSIFVLKDQILLYILYNYTEAYNLSNILKDKINLMFVTTNNTISTHLFDFSETGAYVSTTLDYIWANFFYSSISANNTLSTWIRSELTTLQATDVDFVANLDQTSPNYNADYVINFQNSPYPKSAYTYKSQTDFAYTPYTIIDLYLKRSAVEGNFLNNYETVNGVLMANKGSSANYIFVVPSLFSTVLQILSKIAPTDYFAIKTEFLTSILPQTQMNVNYYPVTNGILVNVFLQHELGIVALTFSSDGSSVYDKRIITEKSTFHSFVLNAPKSSDFVLNVNPILDTV